MPAPHSNDPGAAGGFDPNRHRKEIEQMEKRFRERSERHGGGPVSTGEIDSRVADEMKQFFDASAQQLQAVVPQLQEGEQARAMSETTGEIRKKIDDFFAQVKEAGGGESSPDTQELTQRKSKWAGMFPGQEFAKPASPARAPAAAAPAPAPFAQRPAAARIPPESSSDDLGELPVSAAPPTMSGAKMDLKTALEKLRRSGSGRSDEPVARPAPRAPAPAAQAPAPAPRPAPRPAAPVAEAPAPRREPPPVSRPASPPPAPEPVAAREPAPTRSAMAQPPAPRSPAVTPAPGPVPVRAAMAASGSGPTTLPVTSRREPPAPKPPASPSEPGRQFGGRQYAAPTQAGGPRAPIGGARLVAPDRTGPVIDRPPRPRMHAALTTTEINSPLPVKRESPIKAARQIPADLAGPARAAPEPPAAVEEASSESVEVAAPVSEAVAPAPAPAAAPPSSDPGDSFDSIFDEVQCIVMDTLKVSVDETFQAAREAEPEISQAISQPVAPAPRKRAAEPLSRASDEIRRDEARSPEPPAAASPPSRRTQFARPEEDEDEEQDEAPAAAYDWGVKPSAKPKGAWLLDTPDTSAEPVAKPITTETDAPPASAQAATGGGGGARGYLVRKAGEEVRRFKPVLDALRSSNVLSPEELGDRPASQPAGDDDVMSVDTFRDERPRDVDLEEELSPMRLVEELRRLKRVTQALVTKGLISQEDLNKSAGD